MVYPSDHIFAPQGPLVAGPDSTVPGKVVYSVSAPAGGSSFNGTGRLAQLTLKIIKAVGPGEKVECNLTFEGLGIDTFMLDKNSLDIPYTPVDAHYSLSAPAGPQLVHDVAIIDVAPVNIAVGKGIPLNITVTVENQGNFTENFNVTVAIDSVGVVPSQRIENLSSGGRATLLFIWDTSGSAVGNYTLTATADTVTGETDTADNTFNFGLIHVMFMGDVNGDGVVNMQDIMAQIVAFNSHAGHSRWNPYADMTANNRVDMRDILLTIINFGKHYP